MYKHQEMEHGGAEVQFILQPVSYHKTALGRQVAEAVRIRRRGGEGAILNSKSEFSRCRITRLQIEVDPYKKERELQEQKIQKLQEQERESELVSWERERVNIRSQEMNKRSKMLRKQATRSN